MPRIHLTEKAVARLRAPHPSGRQVLFWDEELKGFGVLCSGATTAKSYVVQREINGKTRRVTVGPCNVLSLQEARKKAEAVLGQFLSGIDPKHGRRGVTTLRQALDRYLEARHSLRPKSAKDMRVLVEN